MRVPLLLPNGKEPQTVRRKDVMNVHVLKAFTAWCLLRMNPVGAFSRMPISQYPARQRAFSQQPLGVMPQVAASLLSGSVSGAIGIGIAYPLDTLKTKSQLMDGTREGVGEKDGTLARPATRPNMFEIMDRIYQDEGIQGFFGGVRAMMIGQAFIKAVAFCANDSALAFLRHDLPPGVNELTLYATAACFSGFVTSFVTAPAERIKIIMQANGKDLYENDWDCFTSIIRNEGIGGLFSRGLGTTLLRDTPSYGLYFVVYHVLMNTPLAYQLGDFVAPLSFGAFSGCLSWIPIYPIDVVKVS